jgi:hypothetical protein
MGYITNFYGNIEMKDKLKFNFLKEISKTFEVRSTTGIKYKLFDFLDILFNDKTLTIEISGEWKNYNSDIERMCYIIACLDKNATGSINCNGEENEDMWKVYISKGKVEIEKAEINYVSEGIFADKEIRMEINKLLKDKELNTKVLLNCIK